MTRTVIQFTDSSGYGGAEEMLLTLLEGLDRRRWEPVLMHHDGPGISPMLERAHRLGVRTRAVARLVGRRDLSRLPRLIRRDPIGAAGHLSRAPFLDAAMLLRPPGCDPGQDPGGRRDPAALFRDPSPACDRETAEHRGRGGSIHRRIARSRAASRRDPAVSAAKDSCDSQRRSARALHRPSRPATGSLRKEGDARPVVLTLARLDRQKGLTTLLEAAELVPEARFVVAGEGPERPMLEAQIRRLGLEHRVTLLGHRSDVPQLLAGCDLFVLPSLYEGLPVSILEAMAAEKPVVATAIGGTDEAVLHGSTGLLAPAGNAVALAAAIRQGPRRP